MFDYVVVEYFVRHYATTFYPVDVYFRNVRILRNTPMSTEMSSAIVNGLQELMKEILVTK